jgi:hypothetical protein
LGLLSTKACVLHGGIIRRLHGWLRALIQTMLYIPIAGFSGRNYREEILKAGFEPTKKYSIGYYIHFEICAIRFWLQNFKDYHS